MAIGLNAVTVGKSAEESSGGMFGGVRQLKHVSLHDTSSQCVRFQSEALKLPLRIQALRMYPALPRIKARLRLLGSGQLRNVCIWRTRAAETSRGSLMRKNRSRGNGCEEGVARLHKYIRATKQWLVGRRLVRREESDRLSPGLLSRLGGALSRLECQANVLSGNALPSAGKSRLGRH